MSRPLTPSNKQPTMDQPSEEARRFLRQFCLIRYNSLIQRINQKIPMDAETIKKLTDAIINVTWIDETLDEVKALPKPLLDEVKALPVS
jgi:hypothetical protein